VPPDCAVRQRSNDSLRQRSALSSEQCSTVPHRSQSSEVRGAPDCPMQQDDKSSNDRPAPNPNGCADVARTGKCTVVVRWRTGLSGAPIASSLHQRLCKWLGAINTPTTSFITIQTFQTSYSIQEQETPLQDTSNRLNPL
jgi:hypothetical protein